MEKRTVWAIYCKYAMDSRYHEATGHPYATEQEAVAAMAEAVAQHGRSLQYKVVRKRVSVVYYNRVFGVK